MTTNSFETGLSDYHIYYSQNKIWKFWTEEISIPTISDNMIVINLNWINSMSDITTHTAFENNFVSILDKQAPQKIKTFTRKSRTPF